MQIIADDPMMGVKIYKNKGEYHVSVKVYNGIINEWNLGNVEHVAKAKAATIVNTYLQALDELQKSVVKAYDKEMEGTE